MLNSEGRPGTTLIELLVVLVLLSLIAGAIMHVAIAQERLLDAVDQVTRSRRAARDGADIPREELRAVSPATGGIYGMDSSHVEFRALVGASALCQVDSARTTVAIPDRLSWSAITSWIASPREGDTVLVFDSTVDSAAPVWRVHTLASAPSPGGRCPAATGLARSSAEEGAALSFRLAQPLELSVGSGAALRFFRRSRYELYRAGDGRWYLGFLDCTSARSVPCSTVQPVSGPFEAGGVRFAYRDSAGALTADPTRVALIDILSRAGTDAPLRAMGFALGVHSDSILTHIALRNR